MNLVPTETIHAKKGLHIDEMVISVPPKNSKSNCTMEFDIVDREVASWDPAYTSYNVSEQKTAEQSHCRATWGCRDPKYQGPTALYDILPRGNDTVVSLVPTCDSPTKDWDFDTHPALVGTYSGELLAIIFPSVFQIFRAPLGSWHEPDVTLMAREEARRAAGMLWSKVYLQQNS